MTFVFILLHFSLSLGPVQSEVLIMYVLLMVTKASIVTDNPEKNMTGSTNNQVRTIEKF